MNNINMSNKLNASLLIFGIAISMLFACDKENINKKYGQYSLAISYSGKELLELHFMMDGNDCGTLAPISGALPTRVQDCSTLKKPENLTNVFVLKEITPGAHTLEIKTADGNLVKKLEFQMVNKECVFQDINIPLN